MFFEVRKVDPIRRGLRQEVTFLCYFLSYKLVRKVDPIRRGLRPMVFTIILFNALLVRKVDPIRRGLRRFLPRYIPLL